MRGEVIHEIIPHLRVMLMLLLAIPRVICDRERSARLEHERNCAFRDLHLWWRLGRSCFEFLVCNAVGNHAAFEGDAAGLEGVGASAVSAVDQAHEFRGDVAVVVGWSVGV